MIKIDIENSEIKMDTDITDFDDFLIHLNALIETAMSIADKIATSETERRMFYLKVEEMCNKSLSLHTPLELEATPSENTIKPTTVITEK